MFFDVFPPFFPMAQQRMAPPGAAVSNEIADRPAVRRPGPQLFGGTATAGLSAGGSASQIEVLGNTCHWMHGLHIT